MSATLLRCRRFNATKWKNAVQIKESLAPESGSLPKRRPVSFAEANRSSCSSAALRHSAQAGPVPNLPLTKGEVFFAALSLLLAL
jgi:hypothetical protein